MKTLPILGTNLQFPLHYTLGHSLTAAEAAALNGLLHKNLEKRIRPLVEAEQKKHGQELPESVVAELQDQLAQFFADHSFSTPRAPRTFNLVQKEAFKIVRPLVIAALKRANIDVRALPDGKLEQLMLEKLAKSPDIRAEAQRRVNAMHEFADAMLGNGEGTKEERNRERAQ